MVFGAVAKLSASVNRVLPFIQSFVKQGLSANEALSSLISAGQGIRRQDFLNAYSYVRGTQQSAYPINAVRKDYFPDLSKMPDSLTDIRREYSYNVELKLKSHDTGQSFTKNITVTSDDFLRRGQIDDEARDAFYSPDADREDTNVEIESMVVVEWRRRGTMFYAGAE
jgi:hypothetical protein